jgi:hypothetical protein
MPPVEHQKCVGSLDVPLPEMVLSSQRKLRPPCHISDSGSWVTWLRRDVWQVNGISKISVRTFGTACA